MTYYKQIKDGVLIAIGTGPVGGINIEITETEYNELLSEIREKARLTDALYSGEITLDAVPAEWQEEIQARVEERRKTEAEAEDNAEATDEDFISALAELGVTVNEEN